MAFAVNWSIRYPPAMRPLWLVQVVNGAAWPVARLLIGCPPAGAAPDTRAR